MGNYLNSPGKCEGKRKLSESLDQDEESKVQDELNTPKRKKLKSTSRYIYETLFQGGENSDVTISAMEKEWMLHKVYLCQSGYFCSMFKGPWKESGLDYIRMDIPDENIDQEALDIAFGSLYRDDVLIKPTNVVPVLAAATLLSLEELINQCACLMLETMSSKTVCCYHIASSMYGQKMVTESCSDWLQKNLMSSQTLELLRDVNISLMSEMVASSRLFVMQVEMDVYTMLRKWLFLQLKPSWQGSLKDLLTESDEYFKAIGKLNERAYLDTETGSAYASVYKGLRLQHVINDLSSAKIVEQDLIIPKSWLEPVYRMQWLQLLRMEQNQDSGPSQVDHSEFCKRAMRCGRVLQKEGQYCWRWTGYNFGVDLLVSFASRLILFKRNTLTQNCPCAVSLHDKRTILFELKVVSFNEQGQTQYEKTTGIRTLSLGKDEEAVVLGVDRKVSFPIHISCHFLVYTPLPSSQVSDLGQGETVTGSHNRNCNENQRASTSQQNISNNT